MSRAAEKAHLAYAKKLDEEMQNWTGDDFDNAGRFPWPRGALRVTQLKPGKIYKAYNIDNINPMSGSLEYYVGKRGDAQVFRFGNSRGGEWEMYQDWNDEWVCCSGADRMAFFGPYESGSSGVKSASQQTRKSKK
jgi:hypothetical protein